MSEEKTSPGLGEDEVTPVMPPLHLDNLLLLAAVSDMTLLAHDHRQRLRDLANEIRHMSAPANAEFRAKLLAAFEEYHSKALIVARRLSKT